MTQANDQSQDTEKAVAYIRESEVNPRQQTIDRLHEDLERVADKLSELQERLDAERAISYALGGQLADKQREVNGIVESQAIRAKAIRLLGKQRDAAQAQVVALVETGETLLDAINKGKGYYLQWHVFEAVIDAAKEAPNAN